MVESFRELYFHLRRGRGNILKGCGLVFLLRCTAVTMKVQGGLGLLLGGIQWSCPVQESGLVLSSLHGANTMPVNYKTML